MKKNIITLFVGIIITMICTLSYGAFDPILKLNIKNLNTKNYVVDLLIDNREKKYEYIGESKPEDKEIFEKLDLPKILEMARRQEKNNNLLCCNSDGTDEYDNVGGKEPDGK